MGRFFVSVATAAVAAATARRPPLNHLFNRCIKGLFQGFDGRCELFRAETAAAFRAGGIGLLEPAQRLADGGPAIRAIKGYGRFGQTVLSLRWGSFSSFAAEHSRPALSVPGVCVAPLTG